MIEITKNHVNYQNTSPWWSLYISSCPWCFKIALKGPTRIMKSFLKHQGHKENLRGHQELVQFLKAFKCVKLTFKLKISA